MADNKAFTNQRDRSRVAEDESYELAYLEAKLGVSREQVRMAIASVGNDREKVEQYLTERKTRRSSL